MARWQEQQRQREHAIKEQEYNNWFYSEDYLNQEVDLKLKQREEARIQKETAVYERVWDDLDKKNAGDKKWQEAQDAKAKAEVEKHYKNIEQQAKIDMKVDNAWSAREFEQEYQNMKSRIDYEYNKPYHGPITKEVSDMMEVFPHVSKTREELQRIEAYEKRKAE